MREILLVVETTITAARRTNTDKYNAEYAKNIKKHRTIIATCQN